MSDFETTEAPDMRASHVNGFPADSFALDEEA